MTLLQQIDVAVLFLVALARSRPDLLMPMMFALTSPVYVGFRMLVDTELSRRGQQ
jgi:hypothetical protein